MTAGHSNCTCNFVILSWCCLNSQGLTISDSPIWLQYAVFLCLFQINWFYNQKYFLGSQFCICLSMTKICNLHHIKLRSTFSRNLYEIVNLQTGKWFSSGSLLYYPRGPLSHYSDWHITKMSYLWPIQKKLLQHVLSYFTRVACTKILTYWEDFFWKLILKYFLKKKQNKTKLYWQTGRALGTPCKLTYSTFHFFFFCHQKLDFKTWRGYLNLNLTFMQIY